MSNDILKDIILSGYEEIKFKDLKVGLQILITFQHGFECGSGLVVRRAVVKECNGYCIVKVHKADDSELMLMPACSLRNERYYTRYLK